MTIGITYDLRADYLGKGYAEQEIAEFDGVETIDAIDDSLRSLGHTTERIGHVQNLARRLAAGERWDLIFNIAEGMHGFGREAQVPALLDAFEIPYTFSDPLVLSVALHKGFAKSLVTGLGVATPAYAVVHHETDLEALNFAWPVVAKPVAGGSSTGICKAGNRHALAVCCRNLFEQFRQPVLVETFLPGREFTVGLVGTGPRARVLGVMEILLNKSAEPDLYSYANKQTYKTRVSYRLAEAHVAQAASDIALRIWNGLGGRDAGRLDLRCDGSGNLHFLEINPLAGLHPVDSDLVILCRLLGISHGELIRMILASAQERACVCTSKGTV